MPPRFRLMLVATWLFLGLAAPLPAYVIFGQIRPGELASTPAWSHKSPYRDLLLLHPHAGGHFIEGLTWWDGHYSATYLYQGSEVDLQRLLDRLGQIQPPNLVIQFHELEGFWDGHRLNRRGDSLAFDWSLTCTETHLRDLSKADSAQLYKFNVPIVRLDIHLSDRIRQERLQISSALKSCISPVRQIAPVDAPANALHAIARARRRTEIQSTTENP